MASAQDGGLGGAVLALAERAPGRRAGTVHAAGAATSPRNRAGERLRDPHPVSGLPSEVLGVWWQPGEPEIPHFTVLDGTEPAVWDVSTPPVWTVVAPPRLGYGGP